MIRNRAVGLYTGTSEERHATWLELFFDLVFVFAVAELGRLLHDDLTVGGFLVFIGLFVPVWWAWVGFTYYGDQFGTEDLFYRGVIVAAMFGVIVLATTISDALHSGSTAFTATYLSLRLLVIGLYVRTWIVSPELRKLCRPWIVGFTLGATLWAVSLLAPVPLRYLLWCSGLGIEMVTPVASNLKLLEEPVQVSHLPERFGLFTIIVLGEVILAVGTGTIETEWQRRGIAIAVSGFAIAVTMWALYFSYFDWTTTTQGISGDVRSLLREFVYGYNHPIISAGIVATGVGVQAAIEATADGHQFPLGARVAFVGGLAMFLLAITASQWAAPQSIPVRVLAVRFLAIGVLGAIAVVSGSHAPALIVGFATVTVVGLAVFETIHSRFGR